VTGVTLRLDRDRWREHLHTVVEASPGTVPVAKGNGYGFGLRRLAEEAEALGVTALAVGMPAEVGEVREAFSGDLVILMPYDAADPEAVRLATDPRVISTVTRLTDLAAIADAADRPRVLVEVLTSMRRHGVSAEDLPQVRLDGLRFEGWTIHLPLLDDGRYAEAERLSRAALATAPGPLWFSHLPSAEVLALSRQLGGAEGPPVPVRLRQGTWLWLGDAATRAATATVLDVHPVRRGQRAGYRQRVCPTDGWIVVVSGGTAHGIGLEAPTPATSVRQRAIALATGTLEAAGLALSPFTIAGRKRWFLEPPHMQSSLVFLPRRVTPPRIGDEVPVELRLTTATVDRVLAGGLVARP
jgi:alanine racemase